MRDKPVFCGTWSLLWVRNHFLRKNETFFRRLGFDPWVRKMSWRRKWQPTPVLLPGKFHGRRSLVGYSPWGRKESDTTERLQCQCQCGSKELDTTERLSLILFNIYISIHSTNIHTKWSLANFQSERTDLVN